MAIASSVISHPTSFMDYMIRPIKLELRRRLEAIAHIEVAEVATLAAKAEGINPMCLR